MSSNTAGKRIVRPDRIIDDTDALLCIRNEIARTCRGGDNETDE